MAVDISHLSPGETIDEKYEVIRTIASGGMGRVFLCRQSDLTRLVAVKVLFSLADLPDAQIRFEREARVLAVLDHPGIVRVFGYGMWL